VILSAGVVRQAMIRILIVDDSCDERVMMAAMVSQGGWCEVLTAGSGEDALSILNREHMDLLITDFVMPGVDGLQLANRAVEIDPTLRVLVVTGGMYGRVDALAFALHTPVITKPFSSDQLLGTITTLLAERVSQGA